MSDIACDNRTEIYANDDNDIAEEKVKNVNNNQNDDNYRKMKGT